MDINRLARDIGESMDADRIRRQLDEMRTIEEELARFDDFDALEQLLKEDSFLELNGEG